MRKQRSVRPPHIQNSVFVKLDLYLTWRVRRDCFRIRSISL